jgi:hypothetical protein
MSMQEWPGMQVLLLLCGMLLPLSYLVHLALSVFHQRSGTRIARSRGGSCKIGICGDQETCREDVFGRSGVRRRKIRVGF